MKRFILGLLVMTHLFLWVPLISHADEEFYGIIESRPDAKTGTWVVGGRNVEVTENTELEEDHGPLVVGACVEVEYEGNVVEEIESEPITKCQ
jgi:hypothetical protein